MWTADGKTICVFPPRPKLKRSGMEVKMKPLIFQSDFGRADGAVSAMYGVAYSVCDELKISDLTCVYTI
mgnify:CR=1 FL=1